MFGSRSPWSDMLLSAETFMLEWSVVMRNNSDMRVSADNNMSDLGDLDPNNIPSLGLENFWFYSGQGCRGHTPPYTHPQDHLSLHPPCC